MRWTIPLCLGMGFVTLPAFAQSPTPDTFALVGVRVEVGDGRVIDKTTILLRHGIIAAIGPDLKVPADAEIIKGDGLTVYPGFIDAQMTSGFTLPAAQPDQDKALDTGSEAPASMRLANRKGIRPEIRAVDYLTLTDTALIPIRQAGFTTALIAPSGGNINGMSALVNLSGAPTRDAVVRPAVTMGFGFGGGGARAFNFDPTQLQPLQQQPQRATGTGYPGNLLGYTALLRQTLYDAQYYKKLDTAFARGASVRPPTDLSLMALQPVMAGAMPAVFEADSENQIFRALHIADEFGLKLIVDGGGDAWKLAPALARKQIPVLLSLNFGDEPGVARAPSAGGGFGGGRGRPSGVGGAGIPNGGGGRRQRGQSGVGGGGTGIPNGADGTDAGDVNDPQGVPGGAPGQAPGGEVPGGRLGEGAPAALPEEDAPPKSVIAEQHKKWEEKVANAAKLQSAGVPFVFTLRTARTPTEFMDNLRKAIKAGLNREAALKALTINAAKLYAVDRQMGTVETGKIADLVVMSGDFAVAATRVRYVFIDKSKFDLANDRPTTRPTLPIPAPTEDDD